MLGQLGRQNPMTAITQEIIEEYQQRKNELNTAPRGNQAILPTPQVCRPHPSNQGVGTGLGSIWDAGNPDQA
jgi:hypothetical protein